MRGVLYFRVSELLSDALLAELRVRFLAETELTVDDDFYPDGPFIHERDPYFLPDPTAHWYETNLSMSYYGAGYKRGHLPRFIRCAEWLEKTVVGCEIWYGNDCADDSIRQFGPAARVEALGYFNRVGHGPDENELRDTLAQTLQSVPPKSNWLARIGSILWPWC